MLTNILLYDIVNCYLNSTLKIDKRIITKEKIIVNWELMVGVACLYNYGFAQVFVKKIGAVEGSRTRKLVWQYFFAASLALITGALYGQLIINWSVIIVAVIGAANAFGCYCHWRAYDISMARTAVLSSLDDLIAITLGYAHLGELAILTPTRAMGIMVSVISAIVFARVKNAGKSDDTSAGRKLILWVFGYSIIWGFAIFSMRFFAIEGLHLLSYVAAWYVGAYFGALVTRFGIMGKKEAGQPLTHIQLMKVLLLAVVIWTSLMFAYWMRELVPITIIQPIQLVGEMSIPTIIALIFFGEARTMSRTEIVVIISGLIGVALIAIAF